MAVVEKNLVYFALQRSLRSAPSCLYVADLLLVGVGEPQAVECVDKHLYKDLKEKGINVELVSTVSFEQENEILTNFCHCK